MKRALKGILLGAVIGISFYAGRKYDDSEIKQTIDKKVDEIMEYRVRDAVDAVSDGIDHIIEKYRGEQDGSD